MAIALDIADAVVAELAGGSFGQTFTPVRHVLPEYELGELQELRVTVVPAAVETEGASRSSSRHDFRIDVGVQKKLGTDLDAEVAELCTLMDELSEFLQRRPLQSIPQAAWVRTANEPLYAPDHLAEQRTFTSVLRLTYRVLS